MNTTKQMPNYSAVELAFKQIHGQDKMSTQIPYILVDNFPNLGLFTALRFLEWAAENPMGLLVYQLVKRPNSLLRIHSFFCKIGINLRA
jgi:glucosamine-6-phosphate deaminase